MGFSVTACEEERSRIWLPGAVGSGGFSAILNLHCSSWHSGEWHEVQVVSLKLHRVLQITTTTNQSSVLQRLVYDEK